MKILFKKEFDGKIHTGTCENVPGCFVQADDAETLKARFLRAVQLIKQNCEERNQPFPTGRDRQLFDIRIRFKTLSTDQLVKIFEKKNYHIEFENIESVLMLNSDYPFNRVHLPRAESLSPQLVQKIFGKENTIHIGQPPLKLNASVS